MTTQRIAITGASGYVGGALVRAAARAGLDVVALSRSGKVAAAPGVRVVGYDLDEPVGLDVLRGCAAVVHAAHDFSPRDYAALVRRNLDGSRRLLDAAAAAGVGHVVFVSSVAAFPGCVSDYGRVKLAIEGATLERGGSVVRPGLVFGERPGSVMGALAAAARRLPVLPVLVGSDHPLFLAHEDDVGDLAVAMALGPEPGAIVVGACSEPIRFATLLRRASGGSAPLVPVPWRPVYALLRAAEATGAGLGFRADSLRSLATSTRDPFGLATAPASRFGVAFRPYPGGG